MEKKVVSIGSQNFAKIRENEYFYVDKTQFIREWWENGDEVTLLARPRRFGKTLGMSTLECFFSKQYAGRDDLFEGLSVYGWEKYRQLQGQFPVVSVSFADVKGADFEDARRKIARVLMDVYQQHSYLLEGDVLTDDERWHFRTLGQAIPKGGFAPSLISTDTISWALKQLSSYLYRYYGTKPLIFLDEYDTPMQEAWLNHYWEEIVALFQSMFNSTFKTNPYLGRAMLTGITRVSKESIFSDLNNLAVVTLTSDKYAGCFGFTEEEVFAAMDAQGMPEEDKPRVKEWYDGYRFGSLTDIYNPWSITSYLDTGKLAAHWVNTSGNGLVSRLVRTGKRELQESFEGLLHGETVKAGIDENTVFQNLEGNTKAVWSLLLATGYLKVVSWEVDWDTDTATNIEYELALTNREVRQMFAGMFRQWFSASRGVVGYFVQAMLSGDVRGMNRYMNQVALNSFSVFDSGNKPSETAPERFYHGFVLGLMVERARDYIIRSNRESGYGRYDVLMEPKDKSGAGVILEFKVIDREYGDETGLSDTADNALRQIEERQYETELLQAGVAKEKIYKYGLAFEGKKCLVKKG